MKFLDSKAKKIGFYSTVIFHLLLLISFLITTIGGIISEETSFVLDFSKQELEEQLAKELQIKEDVSKELDAMLSGKSVPSTNYRNVVVNRSSKALKDDRFKDPSKVYDEAKALQDKLDAARDAALREQGSDEDVAISDNSKDKSSKTEAYKGPSVVSFSLDNRKAISLPVPVYKCYGGGDVSVRIIVNNNGYVVGAQVIESASAADECIREYAVRAARRSRFSASATAENRQVGEIVYRFIAQ